VCPPVSSQWADALLVQETLSVLVKRVREVRIVPAVHAQQEASDHVELGAVPSGVSRISAKVSYTRRAVLGANRE
jgi:hypothetical protein